MSDPNSIQACKDLVTYGIGSEFVDADPTLIGNTPEIVVEYGSVALMAQHSEPGDKLVNLRMPAILRWLRALAENGTGPSEKCGDIMFKLVNSTLTLSRLSSRGKC